MDSAIQPKLEATSRQARPQSWSDPRPRTGIVLAAGNGLRMKGNGVRIPKVLLRVGGLHLVERAILTHWFAGIERIRLVLGNDAQRVVAAVGQMERLRGIPLEIVLCEDFELGNGASLRAGARDLEEPFVVTMADHVLSGEMVRELVDAATGDPDVPHLLVDPDPAAVFDLDDATKVRTADGAIAAIGKEIADYDVIDTGVFHFPAGAGRLIDRAIEAGGRSVSDIVAEFMARDRFATVTASHPIWQDVDTPEMAREAEQLLLNRLPQPEAGTTGVRRIRPLSPR